MKKDNKKKTLAVMYTWSGFTFCICAMDLALAIIFGIDFNNYQSQAYNFNLDTANPDPVDVNSSLLVAAMVVTISLVIIALKGFILWIINCGLMTYFLIKGIAITNDMDGSVCMYAGYASDLMLS